jgi:butyrate kinase
MENNLYAVLAINPGSTSTKIAVYEDDRPVFVEKIYHSVEELKIYVNVMSQYNFRKKLILKTLAEKNYDIKKLRAVVGRGGLMRPVEGGTYVVDECMLEDLKSCRFGEHASNLGAVLAYEIGNEVGIPAYVVDPVVVDEMEPLAKITGIPEILRRSVFHALNQKAVARKAAALLGKRYEEINIIVAHLGGGITVGAHRRGKVVDVNNGLDGEGPFSPERAGKLPALEVAKMCITKNLNLSVIKRMLAGGGGLVAHLGTSDAKTVREMIKRGDTKAGLVFEAMAYQVAREIGACAAVLSGKVDAIALTGGLAYDEQFVEWIKKRVDFIADVYVFPGEDELEALAHGALRVLKGLEDVKIYKKCDVEAVSF